MTAPPHASSTSPAELAWGMRLLRGLLLALAALVGSNVLLALRGDDPTLLWGQLGWWAATLVLLWNVWRGSVWSWRITVALSFVAGFFQLLGGLFLEGWVGWAFALRGLLFVVIGLYLVADGPLRRALEARWKARRPPSPPHSPPTPRPSAEEQGP